MLRLGAVPLKTGSLLSFITAALWVACLAGTYFCALLACCPCTRYPRAPGGAREYRCRSMRRPPRGRFAAAPIPHHHTATSYVSRSLKVTIARTSQPSLRRTECCVKQSCVALSAWSDVILTNKSAHHHELHHPWPTAPTVRSRLSPSIGPRRLSDIGNRDEARGIVRAHWRAFEAISGLFDQHAR